MVVSRAHPPPLPSLLLLEYALKPPTTRAESLSRASLARVVTAIDSSTAVRHRRQHCRGVPLSEIARVPVAGLSNNAAQMASVKNLRAPTPSANDSHGVVPAAGTSASSVDPPSQFCFFSPTARRRASSDVPLGHGLSSATGTALPAPFL